MIRTHWMTSSAAAKAYYRASDYYAEASGQWLGEGARMLGLEGPARAEDFDALADNRDPRTGEPLTTYTRDGRRVGLDMTFNSTKSVGIARELAGKDNAGDPRIEEAHREAVAYTLKFIEADMRGRVRVGGKNEDRVTGNLVAYRVTHRDTRISPDDRKPDMSLHDHVFLFNATWDGVEDKWKAAEIGRIKHDAPYYEALYHNRLATNLRAHGYGVRRKDKAFEIEGVSDELVRKFSRRRAYIQAVAEKLGITSPAGHDKLGATTRLGKSREPADDLNAYYVSRLTHSERRQLALLPGRPSYQSNETAAVTFAIEHLFERQSVVDERRLYETALRHGIGSVTPEGVRVEAQRQGLLTRDGQATTATVLAEERRLIAFAREGRGTLRPLGQTASPRRPDVGALSAEQQALCRHVWESPDRVILIRGGAGTGKTRTMTSAVAGIGKPVVVLAPSAEASRGVLRQEGFAEADTVARFLQDEKFQEKAKGGVIWVDEAGLLGVRQTRQVFDVADRLGVRVVLQGDKRQHASVERGAVLRVLEEFAGLPVAQLQDIRRQRGQYKEAVAALARGDIVGGCDKLDALGWIQQTPATDHNAPLVAEYLEALRAGKQVLVVAPTHQEGDEITQSLRGKLQERGLVSTDEQQVEQLRPLGWTEAEKADPVRYDGTEILQLHRNSGPFRAGQRVRAADLRPDHRPAQVRHFAVYTPGTLALARGDVVRITANGKTRDGKHKLNNGARYTVAGFTPQGDVALSNGWIVARDYGHLAHGYVATSHASQGKTVDRVLIALGHESLPAITAEQFYVSVSRGKERATLFTDLAPAELRAAIQRSDRRTSATELLEPQSKARPERKTRARELLNRVGNTYRQLRDLAADVIREATHAQEREGYAR